MRRIERTALMTVVAVASVLLAGCDGSSLSNLGPTTIQEVSSAEVEAMLDGPEPPVVLDVRSAAEYEAGWIPGSVNIPLDELPARLNELDPETPVVCVCASGYRSGEAAQILALAGFDAVMNLEGGIRRWNGDWEPDCPSCG
jgi:rhodanese-related sulfurtransferase